MSIKLLNEGVQDFIVESKARWFLKHNGGIGFSRGFTSKEYASLWISSLGRKVDWRVGYTFALRGNPEVFSIVNRQGKEAKPS